jgi:hypothetical protein
MDDMVYANALHILNLPVYSFQAEDRYLDMPYNSCISGVADSIEIRRSPQMAASLTPNGMSMRHVGTVEQLL